MKPKSITALLAAAASVLTLSARCNDQVNPDRANAGASGERQNNEDNVKRAPSNQQGKGSDGVERQGPQGPQ
jgi:hypothetical protein